MVASTNQISKASFRPDNTCPWCSQPTLKYGWSLARWSLESTVIAGLALEIKHDPTIDPTRDNRIGTVVNKLGLGVFGFPLMIFREFRNIPSSPLLNCGHCHCYSIRCTKCHILLYLNNHPPTSAMIECH